MNTENRAVGLPHHRRPLKQSRKLFKWSVALGAAAAVVALAVVVKII